MAQVQVGLGAVVGDVDLAVLERVHGARVHVQVGIEFLDGHPQAARFQQQPDGDEAMPLPSDDTTPPVTKMYFTCRRRATAGPLSWDLPAPVEEFRNHDAAGEHQLEAFLDREVELDRFLALGISTRKPEVGLGGLGM